MSLGGRGLGLCGYLVFGNPVAGIIAKDRDSWNGPPQFLVTSPFGIRPPIQGHPTFHDGIDIDNGGQPNDPILAMADGTVIAAGTDSLGAKIVRLDHGKGWTTGYGHLNRIDVLRGQKVSRGQRIGTLGSTGNVTGPHLHFDTSFNTLRRDPWPLLDQNVMRIQGKWVSHIVNKRSELTDDSNFRSTPFSTGEVLSIYPRGTGVIATVEVIGQKVGTAADADRWYGSWLFVAEEGYTFGYLHSSLFLRNPLNTAVLWDQIEEGTDPADIRQAQKSAADHVLEAAKLAARQYGAS